MLIQRGGQQSLTTVRSETCTTNNCSSVGSRYIQTTNTYDWAGRRSAVALDDQAWGGTGTDTTTSFEYNSAGDITKVTYPDAKTMTINRDLTGKPTGHKYPDATIYKYVYDAGQHLYKAQLFYFPIYVDLAEYTYNADGAVIDETLGGSMSSRRQWTRNSANGAVDKYVQNLSTDNRTTPIKYDADGRIRQDCKGTGTGGACNDGTNSTTDTDVRTVYSYDTASQLTQAETNNDTTTDAYTKWEYAYGNRGQRTSQTITKNTTGATYIGYAYDANQQLCRSETSTSSTPTPTCSAFGSTVTSYDYDRAGRRTQVSTPGAGNYTRTFTYDPRGILEQSANTPTGASTTTTYIANNAFGQLTCRNTTSAANCQTTGPTTTNNYLYWDHTGTTGAVPQVLQGMVDNIDFRYVYGGSRISLWGYFFGQDHLTNTTNLKGQSTVTTYSPYGEVLNSAPNTFQYRGELGWTAGLYLRNRNYDPTTGTFLTRDPLPGVNGTPTVANPYHYTNNDPLNMVDPTGLRASDRTFGSGVSSPRMQMIRFQQAPRLLNDAVRGALFNSCSVGVGPTPDVGAGRAAFGARTGRFLKRMLAIHPFADLGDLEDDKCYPLPGERSPGVDFDFLGIHEKNITQMERDVCTSLTMIGHCRAFRDVKASARSAADLHFPDTGQQDGGKWNAALHMFTSAFSALEQGLDYAEFFMNLHEWANPNPFPHLNQMDLLNNYYAFRIVEQALIDEGLDRGDWFEGEDLDRVRNRVTEDIVQFINDDLACEVQREDNPFEPGKDMFRFFIRPERCGV